MRIGGWQATQRSRMAACFGLFLTVVLAAGVWGELALRLNYDAGWLITVAEQTLGGRRLYTDIVEINPPLIVWLTQLPVRAARLFGIDSILAFRIFVFAMIAGSVGLMRRPAHQVLGRNHSNFLLLIAVALVPLTWKYFGEREHLAVILLAPYLIINSSDAAPGTTVPTRVAAGLLAGLGFSLKPHFAPLFLITCVLRRRPWRTLAGFEHQAAALAAMVLYAMAALPSLQDYLALVRTYGGLYWQLLHRPGLEILFGNAAGLTAIATMLTYAGLRPTIARPSVPDSLAVACCWFLAVVVLQGKGLSYHYYPAFVLGLLTIGWVLLDPEPARPVSPRQSFRVVAAALLAAALSLGAARTAWSLVDDVGPEAGKFGELVRLIDRLAPGGRFAALDMELAESFPAANYTTASWDLGWPSIWFIEPVYRAELQAGMVLRTHEPAAMTGAERAGYSSVVRQLIGRRPDVLLFRRAVPGARSGTDRFDFLPYFTKDSALDDLLARCYERLADTLGRAVFRRSRRPGRCQ